MNSAIYLRVSTESQTVEPQRMELLKFIQSKGWPAPVEYLDIQSGAKVERQGLKDLMHDVRMGRFNCVLAVKIDRIARSLSHFASIVTELRNNDVALVLTSQGIDTTHENPMGKMQLGILAVFAEFERDIIRERTRAGLNAARARGVKLGRKNANIHPDHKAIIERWRSNTQGYGYRELAQELRCSLTKAWQMAKAWEAEQVVS